MEPKLQSHKTNGSGNGDLGLTKKSRPRKAGPIRQINGNTFDPMKYMLKLPKNKKVNLGNGQVKWEQTETDYLPVAARIAWFRKDHPDWSIITKAIQLANKADVMKEIIKDHYLLSISNEEDQINSFFNKITASANAKDVVGLSMLVLNCVN